MYEERGYREREIPELILTKNLAGMEIDSRAAQIAELALAMCAREHDRRFFRRGIRADVTVLSSIPLGEDELPGNKKLAEELSHLGEIGSLLNPSEDEIDELKAAAASCSDDLFAATAKTKLESAAAICEKLSRRFTCTVANPPYMGSSSFNPFMSKWIKKNYPDVKSDLCTCFIERGFNLVEDKGYAAMVTMQSWMFLGSFEKMRAKVIDNKTIVSMAHLGPRAFDAIGGEVVNVTADVIYNGRAACEGAYVRLVDINGSEAKRLKLLEAIRNPDCGWFYRRDADTFKQIPGTPIAYWASDALLDAFGNAKQLSEYGKPRQGLATGENARFVREWWEVDDCKSVYSCGSIQESIESACKWFPYNKGGDFRKWYGNNSSVVNWENDGQEIRNYKDQNGRLLSRPQNTNCFFSPSITWSKISSGSIAFRFKPAGHIFDVAGTSVFSDEESLKYLQGACNSSVIMRVASMLSPTLNFEVGQIATYPIIQNEEQEPLVNDMVDSCRELSKTDWDSFETSWDFKHNPLV